MSSIHHSAAAGFAVAVDAYQRGRPGFPADAVAVLRDELDLRPGRTVVDVGAGTGKFTHEMVATGARVVAIEPVTAMREQLEVDVPDALALDATAETTGLETGSVDAVVAAQAMHWFDASAALDEWVRILREDGGIGLIWNVRDESVDWIAQLTRIMDVHAGDTPRYRDSTWRPAFDDHPRLTPLEHRRFRNPQTLTPDRVVDRVMSVSFIAALDPVTRAQVADEVRSLLRDHPDTRGHEQVELSYVVDVYWTHLRPTESAAPRVP